MARAYPGQKLRVLSADSPQAEAAPSIARSAAMPVAFANLADIFAEDPTVCVRPRAKLVCPEPEPVVAPPPAPVPEMDPQLARLVELWPELPQDFRDALLEAVESAKDCDQ